MIFFAVLNFWTISLSLKGRDTCCSASGKGKGSNEKEWVPCTKLGRLVKEGRIASVEDIYLHSLPIKEYRQPLHPILTLC